MSILIGLSVLYLASTVQSATGQASNFNVSVNSLLEYGCDTSCQEILAITNAGDLGIMGTAFDFEFYNTADNFSASVPGDLLKIQAVDSSNLIVPAGMATFRSQYTSKDSNDNPVPSTGFIAIPYALPANQTQFHLIAYAHGTLGVHRGCAPSSSPSLFNYDSWTPLIYHGYAMVATDYAGLGNNYTLHQYTAFTAHANDIYYSVQAARKAFPGLFTENWASLEHSQGGGAVWKLSEHPLVQHHSSGYLGTVSVAPAAKVYDMAVWAVNNIFPRPDFHQFVVAAEMGQLVYGIKATFPNYTTPWLAQGMQQRIALANIAQSCTLAFMGLSFDLPRNQYLASNATLATDEVMKKFQELNAPAQGDPASKPILVIQGWNDTAILPEFTLESFQATAKAGNEAHLLRYPGLDHSASLTASSPVWLKFLEDLFSRKYRCRPSSDTTIAPFDLSVAKTPLELPLNQEPLLGLLGQ